MCIKIRTLAVALLAVTVAGCGAGGNGSSGAAPAGGGASTNPAPAVQKDEALAKLVPSDVASDGKIVVGSDASYAPNEFVDTDGTTIIGMDVDLGKAVGQKLGLEVEFQNSAFDGILPGIAAKKYELGMSSFTDNAEREKVVDMVTYFSAGTKMAVPKGNPDGIKHRRPVREDRRRAARHRAGRRPHRAQRHLHQGGQARHQHLASSRPRPTSRWP